MSIQVEISKAILDFEGELTKTLTFREPSFGDFIKLQKAGEEGYASAMVLFKLTSTYTEKELEKLSVHDVEKISEAFTPFLPSQAVTSTT